MRKPKKNPAVTAAARALSARQLVTMTPEQRRERGRNAIACRKDRQKPWYGLLVFPENYQSQGTTKDALFLCDVLQQDPHPYVVFWSQDKNAVKAEVLKRKDPFYDIIEVPWDPHKFRIIAKFEPDGPAQRQALEDLQHLQNRKRGGVR